MNLNPIETPNYLEKLVANPRIEREWVDLLSQLEYIGFRKIAGSVHFERVTKEVLQHAHEESFHAFLLKDAAEKLGLPERPWSENPFSVVGFDYFQNLDRTLSESLPQETCYPAVSWAIEQRVMKLYPDYLRVTKSTEVKSALKQILVQEKRHEDHFSEVPLPADFKQRALEIEETLWQRFIGELDLILNRLSN